jgi:hypothetical protein
MDSVSPVWSEQEVEIERVIALDQEQYQPIIVLPVRYTDRSSGLSVRFRLNDEERAAIAKGCDLVITELTFGGPFTPLNMHVCRPNHSPFDPIEE